jgi:type II secretory pathway pseudopilin PulG
VRAIIVATVVIGCLALALLYVGGRWLAERARNQALSQHVSDLKRRLSRQDT